MNALNVQKRKYQIHIHPNRAQQQGGALLVAMVMIFMLAIMGVSSMRGSTLERRMASNSIQTATTFQGAESASELALNASENMNTAFMNNGSTGLLDVNLQQNIGMISRARIEYVGRGIALGFSLGVGAQNFDALRYRATGMAGIKSVRSGAQVEQGAYRVVPANPE